MNIIQKYLIAFTCFIFYSQIHAQNSDLIFEKITNQSGRSLGFITGIVQDETGFMWFATRNGLYRYNGYSYKFFRNNSNDSLTLPYNDIANLYLDKSGNFWMRHYDELSYFKNEKRGFEYENITSQHYDIEVQIVEDKKGYYWIGPTGKGLNLYLPQNDSTINFSHPHPTYSPNAWYYLDSVLTHSSPEAAIMNPGNNTDTIVNVTIEKDGFYLIAASGEIDKRGRYDYGELTKDNKIIWALSPEKSMWSGGASKNAFELSVLQLEKGNYNLHYISDMSHCCNNWDGNSPNKTNFCGIGLISISKHQANLIQENYLKQHITDTYLPSNAIKDIFIDNNGKFWAVTNKGVSEFNYHNNTFKHYAIDFDQLFGQHMEREYIHIYQDKDGLFWFGSRYGLIMYDLIWGKSTLFQNHGDIQPLTSNTIFSIFEDKKKNIWIGTDNGLTIYNKEIKTLEHIKANNRNNLYDNRIIQIFEDNANNIWVATFKGLNRLLKNRFGYTSLNIEADNQYPTFYDKSANIWYAFDNKIVKYSRSLTLSKDYVLPDRIFSHDDFTGEPNYAITDMELIKGNKFWIATDNKVSRYDMNVENLDYTLHIPAIIVKNDSIKNSAKQILIDNSETIYAFSPIGVYTINPEVKNKNKFLSFETKYEFIEDVNINFFKSAYKDKKGKIWIRTSDGIYLLFPSLEKLELIYRFGNKVKYGPLSDGNLHEDKFGNILFATLPHLIKINAETLVADTISINKIQDWGTANLKVIDSIAWAYSTNGLCKFNLSNYDTHVYSMENGLVDNNINGIEQDRLGYLWISSLKGLSKFDIKEESCENFFRSSDYTSHQFMGNHRKFDMPENEFMFFTTNGFIHFHPDSINLNLPNIVIDRFTIRGKDLEVDTLIYNLNNITLNYKQNFLGFEFAALDYSAPANNKYMYKLEGLDDDWVITDAINRTASYPGLAPGKYTFKVKGSNNDKVWNNEGTSIFITITPPWYKTIVAYITYIIIIISSIAIFISVRERKLQEEKRILEQKVKERTAEIEAQKEELAEKNAEIEEQHQNIKDSIHYAQKIQAAILPPVERLNDVIDDYFILYRPRDIVSGDYYWTTTKDNITIIVAADCTGHGVPGAFMSMLGIAFLNEIVNKEGIIEPHKILERLRQQVITQLHQTGEAGESKDGMDVSLYVIDHAKMKLHFSGAYNPLYIIRNNELNQLKADRMPIGYHLKIGTPFTMEEWDLQKGDCLYNSSDGYPDQFGGPEGRKFMTKKFKELLLKIHQQPMAEQREILNKTFDEWRGETEQIDDVIVIGVKI